MPAPGPDKALCGAQLPNKPKGRTCRFVAGHRTDHLGVGYCHRHGGSTPTHEVAAKREEARRACSLLGLDVAVETDPAVALLDEVIRTQRAVHHYGSEIAVKAAAGESIVDAVELPLFNAERKHLADVTAKALHAGVARRRVELEEDIARQVVAVLADYTMRLGLDRESPEVRAAGVAALQLLPGGTAAA